MKFLVLAVIATCFQLNLDLFAQSRVSAIVDYSVFPAPNGNGRLMLNLGVDGKSLIPQKNPSGVWFGRASFAIVINDSVTNFFAEKIELNTPGFEKKENLAQPFHSSKIIDLPSGKYQIELLVSDHFSSDTSRERLSFEVLIPLVSSKPVMSDLVLLNGIKTDPSKSIYDQINSVVRSSDFFDRTDSLLRFYAEGHGFLKTYKPNSKLVSRVRIVEQATGLTVTDFGFIRKIQPQAVILNAPEISIKTLASGSYLLVWEILDSTGKVVCQSHRAIRKSNPGIEANIPTIAGGNSEKEMLSFLATLSLEETRHTVASLLPIAKASEQTTITYLGKKGTSSELQNYLLEFWKRRNSGNPLEALKTFRDLLQFADQKYATQTMKAYQTERGRVLLQYGKPNIIENEYSDRNRKAMQNLNTIPYEIWYYYTLELPVHQTDVMFVFVQQNRGNDNYRLLHSSGIGEVRNTEWRRALENNATYNFDRMDPNDRGEIGNPRQSR